MLGPAETKSALRKFFVSVNSTWRKTEAMGK